MIPANKRSLSRLRKGQLDLSAKDRQPVEQLRPKRVPGSSILVQRGKGHAYTQPSLLTGRSIEQLRRQVDLKPGEIAPIRSAQRRRRTKTAAYIRHRVNQGCLVFDGAGRGNTTLPPVGA